MRTVLILLLMATAACAQPRRIDSPSRTEEVGSWRITCAADPMTDRQACTMRHRLWVEEPHDGVPGLALEVVNRAGQYVPALTVRDLTLASASRGLMAITATAQIRFDRNPLLELPCALDGRTLLCLPEAAYAPVAAAQLLTARTLLLRMRATGPFPAQGPEEPVALDLEQTVVAVARFRQSAPEPLPPAPPGPNLDLRELFERLQRLTGAGDRPN